MRLLRIRSRATSAAFTLVELLVVIAIITVLASLLLPALQRAVENARTTSCASNQRQHGIGYGMYIDDWYGYFPPANLQYLSSYHFSAGLEKTTPHFLGGYMGFSHWYAEKYGSSKVIREFRRSVFYCPSNPIPYSSLSLFRGGYGQNVRLPPHLETSSSGSWPPFASGCAKAVAIRKPSTITVRADRYAEWHLTKTIPTPLQVQERSGPIDLTRHTDGATFLFADFHVRWFSGTSVIGSMEPGFRIN